MAWMMDQAEPDLLWSTTRWNSAASRFQERIGNCTIVGTARLVDVMHEMSPLSVGSYALDVGAGAGSLTLKIKEKSPSTRVLATDMSLAMLAEIDKMRLPRVETKKVDGVDLYGLRDDIFTHVFSSFAIQYMRDCRAAVEAMYRACAPGGAVGIAIWGPYAGAYEAHVEACRRLNPGYQAPEPIGPGSWRTEDDHREALESAGLHDIRTEVIGMPFKFESAALFTEYWFGYGNPIPRKLIEDWEAKGGSVEALERELATVVKENYEDGQQIYFSAVLGWGMKR